MKSSRRQGRSKRRYHSYDTPGAEVAYLIPPNELLSRIGADLMLTPETVQRLIRYARFKSKEGRHVRVSHESADKRLNRLAEALCNLPAALRVELNPQRSIEVVTVSIGKTAVLTVSGRRRLRLQRLARRRSLKLIRDALRAAVANPGAKESAA